ncbi:MAG: hypothetical protein V4436_00510 [Patescibacteria group bacterium]
MRIKKILPSTQFMLLAGSIAASGALICGAYTVTHYKPTPSTVAVSTDTQNADWKQALEDIQAQSPLNRAPQAPSADTVDKFLRAAESSNLTDTVARTLFINLSSATAQGLGSDIPTQDALVAEATQKIEQERGAPAYTTANLNLVTDSPLAMRTYGNRVMAAILAHPSATMRQTYSILTLGVESGDSSKLVGLKNVGNEYTAIAEELVTLPTPKTLAPLHLSVVNNLSRMGQSYPDMQKIVSDPLRGMAALQIYQSLADETSRVFTSIATTFSKNGILFNKDEPGVTWNSLVP